ncbi:MAG: AAA family ATPase [Roseburia sp.]
MREDLPGITREAEEERLAYVLEIAQKNLEKNENAVKELKQELHDLLETYGAKDVEALSMWNNTVVLLEETKTDLLRSEKARKKPYFGRIDFTDRRLKKKEAYYIGRVGIARDVTHLEVIDWRAPVATVYYENSLGKCSYSVKNEGTYEIDLTRKRTYEIEKDTLKDFYDSDVVANDELLTRYLAKSKKAVLGEIIATIQQEQNSIIRKSPRQNIIVQGVAGSGKTTVAMHRISYILYNFGEEYRPEDFYIVGSNRILLNYITSVLPDLDVYGIRQMTMEQLFTRLLYEDWDDRTMEIRTLDKGDEAAVEKGSFAWFHELEAYCAEVEWNTIPREDIVIDRGNYGIYGVKGQKPLQGRKQILLSKEAIETYIKENPGISLQNKILMLNERIMAKVQNEITGKEVGYTPEEKKEIKRLYRFYFGPKLWKKSIFDMYEEFLTEQERKGKKVSYERNRFDVYDLAALAYLYKRIKETEEIREASHVVIDEAQDFGMMAYAVLKYCMRVGCTFTIMGDVSQNIHFGSGLNDWEELKTHFLTGTYDSFNLLKKSYRNTVEISNFATDILKHGTFPVYPVEPILRHGNSVRVEKCGDEEELVEEAAATIRKWQKKGLETIAVVCRDAEEADRVSAALGKEIPLLDSNLETTEFGSGVMVLPVAYTKGLEFDAVIILNPSRESYPSDNGHVKLLYVAATRALHELAVLHTGNLTGLIEDPIPEERQFQELAEEAPKEKTEKKLVRKLEDKPKTVVGPKRIEIPESQKKKEEGAVPMVRPGTPQTSQAYRQAAKKRQEEKTRQEISAAAETAGPQGGRRTPVFQKINPSPYRFGDVPEQGRLRPAGHGRVDTAVRWNKKTPDYVDIASSYGTLRITPLMPEIIRVSFVKGQTAEFRDCENIVIPRGNVKWNFRETRDALEITTDVLMAKVEKKTGAVQFFTRDGKLLLAEKAKEPRFIEQNAADQAWMFFDWEKSEKIWAKRMLKDELLKMNMSAKYISYGGRTVKLPCVLSERGYGLAFAAESTVMCCDIPMYGPYVTAEQTAQADYCFLYGKSAGASIELYKLLTGAR